MSNFPDRFDGFHTYNRCCRAKQDKGRSKENLKGYTKDRRAYEYWSDGNIHAANMFMGSQYFDGASADHIGPISLGFVHDPRYLRSMSSSDNSTKRDRLSVNDVEAIITVEEQTGVCAMSWYSADIWEFIKANYKQNQKLVPTIYRQLLKQNMANFMFVLRNLLDHTHGYSFLYKVLIEPKYDDFQHAYVFDELGNIIKQTPRNFTERSKNEVERFSRVAFEAVREYAEKTNRNISRYLTLEESQQLIDLEGMIMFVGEGLDNVDFSACLETLQKLMKVIQARLIKTAITA
jgi:Alw26I/Eco31I/Esp3I family type II restriction endonuclease